MHSSTTDHYSTTAELLDELRKRGLRIDDEDHASAIHILSTVGHHRLTAFYTPFYEPSPPPLHEPSKVFKDIPRLKDVADLYSFDRRLRHLLLGPLEKIEVGLRGLLIMGIGDYQRTINGDTRASIDLFDGPWFLPGKEHRNNLAKARKGCREAAYGQWKARNRPRVARLSPREQDAEFDAAFRRLPAWAILQAAPFGPLTLLYSALKKEEIGHPLSDRFHLPHKVLVTVFFALRELRNACAHHEPIWNWDAKRRSVEMPIPKHYRDEARLDERNIQLLYGYCTAIHILLSYLSDGRSTWFERLKGLMTEFPGIDGAKSAKMGFPKDWQALEFWNVPSVFPPAADELSIA